VHPERVQVDEKGLRKALTAKVFDKARRQLGHWTADGLGRAIQAVAAADVEVKGGGRDPVFAVERAILAITAARHDG